MMKTHLFIALISITLLSKNSQSQDPLFPNSVVSNDIDFILDTDPDAFVSIAFLGLDDKEMPDSQSEILFDEDTFIFEATFTNDITIEIWCHSSFLTQSAAQEYADKLCPRLGKLPAVQRNTLDHVVIHNGDATAFAETGGYFFILYSDNMDDRISTHDLEETVFHESIHATYQGIYANQPIWTNAQTADGVFVTEYGQSLPDLEDMAESALFAYTLLIHPGRLSSEIESWLLENIPNRIAFFETIYLPTSTEIIDTTSQLEIEAHPNPTRNRITLILDQIEVNTAIKIYSLHGKLIQSTKAQTGQNEIELKDLQVGVYFLSVNGYKPKRIIKQE